MSTETDITDIDPKNPPQAYDLSGFTVMVVEDSPYMLSLITSMLRAFSVGDIMEAHDAREAMDVITVTQARSKSRFITNIDILLTDWLLPGTSGAELLQWVRTHSRDEVRFMPVIVVSGFTTEKVVNETRDLGANETLAKPISASGLASRICSVIEQKRHFIEIPSYFGPDRRRQDMPVEFKDRRWTKTADIEVSRR